MDSLEYKLISGRLKSLEDIPAEQSHQIKVFISYNSTEFCEERDAIFSRVVPEIREQARTKYGLEFHYLDLKYAIDFPLETNSKRREFMLKELLRCQQLSAKPNFMVLIGQKYGSRLPPYLILSDIFETIQQTLLSTKGRKSRNAQLLDKWYIKDENSIPAVHVLRQASASDKEELQKAWKEDKEALRQVLIHGVELCCKDGVLPPEALRSYFASEFENEVKHGLMNCDGESALVFDREISDLSNYLAEHRVTAFTEVEWNDFEGKWQMVKDNKELLNSLKSEIILGNLDPKKLTKYSILWRYDSGVHPVLHKDYISQLCQDVKEKMLSLISDAAAVWQARRVERSSLINEVLTHWRKAIVRGKDCQGRDKEIDTLMNYIKNDNSGEFFTIYGEMGSGKTCLLSKVLLEMNTDFDDSTITIVRFLGLTQDSSNLQDLLRSLCQQVATCLNRKEVLPTEFPELQKCFKNMIDSVPADKKLVLILDSIHNLLPNFNAYNLQWLPSNLPGNVRIIISSSPHNHGIVTTIKTEIIQNLNNCLEISPLSEQTAMMLMLYWLQQSCMCITNEQADIIKEKFKQCTQPLYIRMLFEEVKKWRSFDKIDPEILGVDTISYLDKFFTRIEGEYGPVLIKHAIAYLTASKTGLSDMEMEDLLSLDETVMTTIYADTIPAIRRCPPYIWAAIRNELEPFLVMKVCDDFEVYFWFHSMVTKYTESRYLNNPDFLRGIHHMIADYYLGIFHGKAIEYTDIFGKKSKADRCILSQPLTYTNSLGEICYNKRKYDQVPRHLYLANRLNELNENVLFNYEWLYNKIKVLSLQHILADLSLNPSTEVTLLEGALRAAQPILNADINNMPVELSGRLLPYYHTYSNIKNLIQQCDTKGLSHCPLIPMFNYHQTPGSPLQFTLNYVESIDNVCLVNGGRYLLAKSSNSQLVRQFDITTGENKGDIVTSYGRLHVSSDNKHLIIVDNEIEKSIKIHNVTDGRFEGQLIPLKVMDVKDSQRYSLGQISISSRYIAILITTDITQLCIGTLETGTFLKIIPLEGKASLVHISPNEKFVLCNVNFNVLAFSLSTFEQICLTQLEYKPTSMVMARNSRKVYYINQQTPIITISHITPDGYTQMVSKIPLSQYFCNDNIKQLKLSNNENMILILSERNIVVYNLNTDKLSLHVRKPESVMKVFRLPKHSDVTSIVYTDAVFSSDDNILMTGLFRNIQFWDLKTGQALATTILAPVGILMNILLSPLNNQIISTQVDSNSIQVWNLSDYVMEVKSLDRLTSPVDSIILTEDNKLCFATGARSDEVAVIDMSTGMLSNLLTHEAVIEEIIPVSDGSYLFVTIEPSKTQFCNKIWSVNERKVVKQFGESRGLTCALRKSNTIIHISQTSNTYQSPYSINIYKFDSQSYQEVTYDFMINYAISKPFVTADDTYMVLLSANEYIEKKAVYRNPSICAIYLKGRYMHSIIGKDELSPFLDTRHIIALVPIQRSASQVIAIYRNKQSLDDNYGGPYGFVCVELTTSTTIRYSDDFMPSTINLKSLVLNNRGSQCINTNSGAVFDMKTGARVSHVNNKMSDIVLLYDGTAAVYYQGPYLIVERVMDSKVLAKCDVHVDISIIKASNDDKTVAVGCVDGTVLSYIVIDPSQVQVQSVIGNLSSRTSNKLESAEQDRRPRTASTWDQMESVSLPSRSHTSTPISLSDKEVLRRIRPVYRSISPAKSMSSYGSLPLSESYNRSKTCSIM